MHESHDPIVLLSAGCSIDVCGGSVVIGTLEDDIRIDSSHPDLIREFLDQLQSGARAYALADALALPERAVGSILTQLRESDLLLDVDRTAQVETGADVAKHFQREARFWAKSIFEQPFWSTLLEGRCSRAQVLGWGVEFYHFVDAANVYMPVGVAHARQLRAQRPAIARHYIEEMNHGEIFLDGLARCGLDVNSVVAAPPLPHTAALINHLTELAYEGAVPYTTSFAVMQPGLSTGNAEQLDEFYGMLTKLYPYAKEMFAAFHRHASLDLKLKHDEPLFFSACRADPGLDLGARRRASQVMQSVAESFVLFFEGIEEAYGDSATFSPRRPFRLEAVQ
jgi:pyrroloquinoline quinone (PQQ) biosynthesis protein C